MKYLIFGAGAVGCYVGGKLAAAGEDVVFYGREKMAKTIAQHGLSLSHYHDEAVHVPNPKFVTTLDGLQDTDVILLCVKSQDTQAAADEISTHFPPSVSVLSLQNGVENVPLLREALPGRTILGGMVPYSVTGVGEGVFHQGMDGALVFEQDPVAAKLVEACKGAGLDACMSPNITGVLWGKLLINLNNALNALADIPLKDQFRQREYRRLFAALIREGLSVLKAAGIEPTGSGKTTPKRVVRLFDIPNFIFYPLADRILKMDPKARSSMWQDLHMGRASEIDHLQGAVCRLGKKVGVATPLNDKVTHMVNLAFADGVSPALSGRELREQLSQMD
jgi:2-dehydropantoate 2-reductase